MDDQMQLEGMEDGPVETPAWEEDEPERVVKKRLEYPDYNPLQNLLVKHDKWLMQQPEWAIILAAPRTERRRAITMLAKQMSTIPQRYKFGG